MNFKWTKLTERGQYETGFLDIYRLDHSFLKAITIIYYLPQHSEAKQRVVATFVLEGPKAQWTDGKLSSLMQDVEDGIKHSEQFRFNNFNSLEYADSQLFLVKSIDEFDYLSHGDWNFI